MAAETDYPVEPPFEQRFREGRARAIIEEVLNAKLGGTSYVADNASQWCREISDEVKQKLKGMALPRYKYVVQTVIAEQRGEGMHMGCRNLWDPKTDGYAQATFQNDTLICITAAFATYLY